MSSGECAKCGKTFLRAAHLRDHLNRKRPCAPILAPEDLPAEVLEDPELSLKQCRFCGRAFSSYQAMRRHVRTACKIAPNSKNGKDGMELLYEHTLRRQQTQIEAQQAQINELLAFVRSGAGPKAEAGGMILQTGNNNQVAMDNSRRTTNVVINVFGQEGLNHVTAEKIRDILEESLGTAGRQALPVAAQAAVLKTAMLVYSDPEHPENLTCYLPNKKTNDALVHTCRPDGTVGWEVQPMQMVVSPMAQKSVDALFDKQPFEDADMFGPLMAELRDSEEKYVRGISLRPILVRNKELLLRVLEKIPVADA